LTFQLHTEDSFKDMQKKRAPLNRTLTLTKSEILKYQRKLVSSQENKFSIKQITNKIINADAFEILDKLPEKFIDLLFVDPPYNLDKKFNLTIFKEMENEKYAEWLDLWISKIIKSLKDDSSIYICGDWKSSPAIYQVANKYFKIRNRITWEREKGRGAKSNWKNCSEDIWFCTMSDKFTFNTEAVKMKRKVLAPYKDNGRPKDWIAGEKYNYRITHPSNIWTDLTVPFWSMPENTDHPTQKPEKLAAKIILASSNSGDMVFDPFIGSGTTAVVAKKLGRKYSGIEAELNYCCITEKRLIMAEKNRSIQGYEDSVFWERNTLKNRIKK
jgi:site-specific DNA-methyltransferase (adenine-specific)